MTIDDYRYKCSVSTASFVHSGHLLNIRSCTFAYCINSSFYCILGPFSIHSAYQGVQCSSCVYSPYLSILQSILSQHPNASTSHSMTHSHPFCPPGCAVLPLCLQPPLPRLPAGARGGGHAQLGRPPDRGLPEPASRGARVLQPGLR